MNTTKHQAPSTKHQAPSTKHQAPSAYASPFSSSLMGLCLVRGSAGAPSFRTSSVASILVTKAVP
eukprot:scaffold8389_cov267-Pinguiococcus_pyrenoidosus.AAC.1